MWQYYHNEEDNFSASLITPKREKNEEDNNMSLLVSLSNRLLERAGFNNNEPEAGRND